MIDFARSFMTFVTRDGGNIARIQVDAACTLIDAAGQGETFYLIAPCRAERMYLDEALFQLPNYEFCGIWSATDFLIVRTHWVSERDNRELGAHGDRFAECRLAIVTSPTSAVLIDTAAIIEATLANRPLVARTDLRYVASGRLARLEYPIKTMNVRQQPPAYQVDTGPLIVPDFAAWAEAATGASGRRPIDCFDLAHIVYCTPDRAEFIRRRPNPVGPTSSSPTRVTDYSAVEIVAAHHLLLSADG